MNIDYAFLANWAEVGADSRLNVMGADFNQLYGQYPLTMPSLALVAKIIFPPEECGKRYHFSAEILKPDGEKMDPAIELDFDTPPISTPDRKGALKFVLTMQGVVFPSAGTYTIRILLNGDEKKKFGLLAEEVPKAETTPVTVA
jgi:hypothetical protein